MCSLMEVDIFQKASNIANDDSIESFAIVNGQAIAANPWLWIENYNASEKSWYQQAVKANGDIIFTDAYMDSVYHRQVVTIAAADPDTGNAIAFDLFPENFKVHHDNLALSGNNSYYVCDTKGTLLYHHTPFDATEDELKAYAKNLFDEIKSGSLKGGNNFIHDLDDMKRSVYYFEAPNG